MPKLSDLRRGTTKLTAVFRLGDHEVELTLDVALDRFVESELNERFARAKTNEELREILADIIVGWDLTDDNGEPLPITPETLAELPLPIIRDLWVLIGEHLTSERLGERRRPAGGS